MKMRIPLSFMAFACMAILAAPKTLPAADPPDLLPVTASMISGEATFLATAAQFTTINDPVPYGGPNPPFVYPTAENPASQGWIWSRDLGSFFVVDFSVPVALQKIRAWTVYLGGARGAIWSIEYSNDNVSWTPSAEWLFETTPGGGVNDDGSPRPDEYGGWYETTFNESGEAYRYWKVKHVANTIDHSPRCGTLQFIGKTSGAPRVKSTAPTGAGNRPNALIKVELQDGVTAVVPGSIQLRLNGQPVTPTITKPVGSSVTSVDYDPQGTLIEEAMNTVAIIFGDTSSPSMVQTNTFSFGVISESKAALIVNVDFNGVRNTETGSQTPSPTYLGQGPVGGGNVWNGILADSRLAGTNNNHYLTVSGSSLLNSIGEPTTVSLTVAQVGGDVGGGTATNATLPAALLGDWVFNNTLGNFAGVSPFTLGGLGDAPAVDLYFYRLNGTVTIPGVSPVPFAGIGIFNSGNTLCFKNVPVSNGTVTGVLGKGTALSAGFTLQKPPRRPLVTSVVPTGTNVSLSASIVVTLQDYVTQVNTNSIQLWLNGKSVSPTLTRAAGITTVTYKPAAGLAATPYSARIIFADSSTPPVVQTNDFSFAVLPLVSPPDLLPVTASMISGEATFLATAAQYTAITNPVPYGGPNPPFVYPTAENPSSLGWIWSRTTGSYFVIDFGEPVALQKIRAWTVYLSGARGAIWSIEYSDDNVSWTPSTEWRFETTPGAGVNDDGSPRPGEYGGWYQTTFNAGGEAHRYWKVKHTANTIDHSPRCGTLQFFGKKSSPDLLPVTASMLSGEATFLATAAPFTVLKDPAPYGGPNPPFLYPTPEHPDSQGWIWNPESYFIVDFGAPVALQKIRAWTVWLGGTRGARWSIESSDDKESWTQAAEWLFETMPGGGVNDDGSPRPDEYGGWYETEFNAGGEAHRYWKVMNAGSTINHSPRCGILQFLGKKSPYPTVKSTAPAGAENRRNAVIKVELQDAGTAVAPSSIRLQLNGQTVTPTVSKPAGTNVTTLTYDAQGNLPAGVNHVTFIYGDTSSPPFVQTNSFSFVTKPDDWLSVTPDMVFGSTTFAATPAGLNIANPIPYGVANNAVGSGWIWVNGSYLAVDFGAPATLKKVRVWVTDAVNAQGAIWAIEYSNDNLSYTHLQDLRFETSFGGGVNDDGTVREDSAGWYEGTFNANNVAARYWRIRQSEVTQTQAPRIGQVEFYGTVTAQPSRLSVAWSGSNLVINWTGTGVLQSAAAITGPWENVAGATRPLTLTPSERSRFYRMQQ